MIDAWQGSEYSLGSKYTRVLNMRELDKVLQEKLYERCFRRFPNIPKTLKIAVV